MNPMPLQMPVIVQIGDVAIHMHIDKWHGNEADAQGKTKGLLNSYRVVMPNAPMLPDVREMNLDVVIFAENGRSVSNLRQLLSGLLGQVTDIFAYEAIGCADDVWPCCCHGYYETIWLKTLGRIDDFRFNSADFRHLTASLSLSIFSYWMPFSTVVWKHGARDIVDSIYGPVENISAPYADHIDAYPGAETWFRTQQPRSWYRKRSVSTAYNYDPAYGYALYTVHDPNLPDLRYASDWDGNAEQHVVSVNRKRWSAPPLSIYMFKGYETYDTDTLTIEVMQSIDIWDRDTFTTTIDVSIVDDLVTDAGETLAATDIIVVGDVKRLPGFVIRGDTIITPIGDAVTRDGGAWPGQLVPGMNKVTADPDGGQFGQHHIFRTL